MPTNLKMLHKNNMLAGMGSVTYATLAKCYRTGGIDSAAWVRGNWGQIKGQKIGDRVRESRAVLFAHICKISLYATYPNTYSPLSLHSKFVDHVDQWTMRFELAPERRDARTIGAPFSIYLYFYL